jgi:hypothetical protein
MKRFFTLEEAHGVLPKVEAALRRALTLKSQYSSAEAALQEFSRRITLSGGSLVNREQAVSLRSDLESAASLLKAALQEIQETGCQIKDLDVGLLDFPTLFRGEEVLLCWKLGEDRIEYWHGLSEGFAGRHKIDDDFLANHRGEETPLI